MNVIAEINEYGWSSDADVDRCMDPAGNTRLPPTVEPANRGQGLFYSRTLVALHQWAAYVGPDEMVKRTYEQFGWTRQAWVRITMICMACVWPKMYIDNHGHAPIMWTAWDAEAFQCDDIKELYGKDF